jgi:hypothetical protein
MSLATKSCDAWKQVAEEAPEIRHRMVLLPGGATKQWLGLVQNVRRHALPARLRLDEAAMY